MRSATLDPTDRIITALQCISFLDDNLSKCMCIDIVEIWFGIANGQISSIFDRVICLPHDSAEYYRFTFLL